LLCGKSSLHSRIGCTHCRSAQHDFYKIKNVGTRLLRQGGFVLSPLQTKHFRISFKNRNKVVGPDSQLPMNFPIFPFTNDSVVVPLPLISYGLTMPIAKIFTFKTRRVRKTIRVKRNNKSDDGSSMLAVSSGIGTVLFVPFLNIASLFISVI
jgi:hypothetical protein